MGLGIRNALKERIFEGYYQGEAANGNTGIRLYLVKEVVENLHGTIEIDSNLGKGTRVTIKLPVS